MIRNVAAWEKWKDDFERQAQNDYFENLRIYEALYEEACLLGVFPPKDPLEGIEDKIWLAKVLNTPTGRGTDRTHP